MIAPGKPANEQERLQALYEYNLLDSMPEEDYDNITRLASAICNVPISLITLIDKDREWFKSKIGTDGTETERQYGFCSHAILTPNEIFVVNDTSKDERFYDNPYVTGGLMVGFYAGVPLVNENGLPLGSLCVVDNKPNILTPEQQMALKTLAGHAVAYFELRKKNIVLAMRTAELEAVNQELERFAAVAAHDLKSPCNTIIMISNVLKEGYGEHMDDEGKEMLDMMTISAGSMTGLVDGILKHTKTVHTTGIEKQQFRFEELVNEVKKLLNIPAGFTVKCLNPNAELITSKQALVQILLNLGTNAIKYNDKAEGVLEFDVKDGDTWTFTVKDNGPGIPESSQKKIFELFTTLGKRDRDNKMGHGIGLSTVKRLVEKLGGEIHVSSQPGNGSTFSSTVGK